MLIHIEQMKIELNNTCISQTGLNFDTYKLVEANIHPTLHFRRNGFWRQMAVVFLSIVLTKKHPKPLKIRIKPDFLENPVRCPVRSGRISALKIRYVRKSLPAYSKPSLIQECLFTVGAGGWLFSCVLSKPSLIREFLVRIRAGVWLFSFVLSKPSLIQEFLVKVGAGVWLFSCVL